jgi:hypothetical protein
MIKQYTTCWQGSENESTPSKSTLENQVHIYQTIFNTKQIKKIVEWIFKHFRYREDDLEKSSG